MMNVSLTEKQSGTTTTTDRRIETDKARKNYVNEFVEKHVLTNSVATDMFFEELSK